MQRLRQSVPAATRKPVVVCTLIVLHHVNDRYPLIVASNRDEAYDRPSTEPDLIQVLPVAVAAPKDLRSGGTWMGAAQGGWVVGLTNQDDGVHVVGKRSRGEVVKECLLLGNHRAATRFLVGLDPFDFRPFNLVFGRPGAMFLCRVHHDRPIDIDIVPAGITVVANDCTSRRAYSCREDCARLGAAEVARGDDDDTIVTKLERVLSSHSGDADPYQSLCVHDDEGTFGTRSSAVILVSADGDIDYHHGEGHPCVSAGLAPKHYLMSLDFHEPWSGMMSDEEVEGLR